MNNMLTAEEVKSFLHVDQPEFDLFLKNGKLHAYKIGGTYLRFRKEDILNLRAQLVSKKSPGEKTSFLARAGDFWRFNNFYIISLLIVLAVIWAVAKIY